MRRLIIISVLLFFVTVIALSQTDSVYTGNKSYESKRQKKKRNADWKKKVTYDGDFQAIFGSVTLIYLTPSIGYIPFKKCNIGLGVIYNYTSINYPGYGRFSQSVFGGHSYLRYLLTSSFFVQGQYDKLLQPDWYNVIDPGKKIWVDYAMIGGGFSQPIGELFAFNTSLMYNLTPQRLSIYPSRFIIQVGFTGRLK